MLIQASHIKALILAAAKKDVRHYMKGIMVNSLHMVATDGARLHAIAHGQQWDHGEIIIPREALEMALKMKTKEVEITEKAIGPIAYTAIDGKYPDYRRVLPDMSKGGDVGEQQIRINPKFLTDACEAVTLVTGEKFVSLTLVDGRYVWGNQQMQAVVMPLREESVSKSLLTFSGCA